MRARKLSVFCLWFVLIVGLVGPSTAEAAQQPLPPVFTFPGQVIFLGADYNLWLLNGDTGERYRLTDDGSDEIRYSSPSFSPDGKKIVYLRWEKSSGTQAIYLLESGSKAARIIVAGNWSISDHPWSPDGKKIIYTNAVMMGSPADPNIARGVFIDDLATGQTTMVQQASEHQAFYDAQWSSNEAMVSFRDFCFECVGQFYSLNLDDGIRFDWSVKDTDLWVGLDTHWSPDGSQIVYDQWDFYNPPASTYGVWAGNADGKDMRPIYTAEGSSAAFPLWSPDGSQIVFSQITVGLEDNAYQRRADLMLISSDGKDDRQLVSGDGLLYPLDWSPDGEMVLYSREEKVSDFRSETILAIYDLDRGMSFDLGSQYYPYAAWSQTPSQEFQLPEETYQTTETEWTVNVPFPVDGDALIYLSRDGELVIHDASSHASVALLVDRAVETFVVSPSQRHIVFKGEDGHSYLMDIQPQTGGDLSLRLRELAAPIGDPYLIAGYSIEFSFDETRFAYQDALDRIWLVDQDGQHQLAYAAGMPSWSHDGQWVSYVTLDQRLYAAQSQGPFQLLGENLSGSSAAWSPTQPILAYSLGKNDYFDAYLPNWKDTRSVMIYNAADGQTHKALDGGTIESWSRDGRVIAITQTVAIGASAISWTNYVVDPFTLQVQNMGSYHSRDANRHGWLNVDEPYIYGAYRAERDLSSASSIAPVVLAAAQDGHTFVTLDVDSMWGSDESISVYCLNDQTGAKIGISDLKIGPLYGAVMPGIWAMISPDSQWVALTYFKEEETYFRIARCDGQTQAELLPDGVTKAGHLREFLFSSNSRWLAGMVFEGENNRLLQIRSLGEEIGSATILPIHPEGTFTWLDPIVFPVEEVSTATAVPVATMPFGGFSPLSSTETTPSATSVTRSNPPVQTLQPTGSVKAPASTGENSLFHHLTPVGIAGLFGGAFSFVFLVVLIGYIITGPNKTKKD